MHRRSLVLALLLASTGVLAQPESPHQQALNAERDGKMREAVGLYTKLARGGDGKAALRIAQIYDKGLGDVPRDEALAAKWYNAARVLGYPPPVGDFPNSGRGYGFR